MTMSRPTLTATHREITGKKVSHLRKSGKLPAVVYGNGIESDSLTIDTHEFEVLRRKAGPNTLIDLTVDGSTPRPVLVSDVQTHRVNRGLLHVDLFLVRMTEELTVDVPLVLVGEAPAVASAGGTLLQLHQSVSVRALPDHLPQSIEIPLEGLVDFDAVVRVADLKIPADATLLTDLEEVVAKVQPPRVEVEEVAPTEAVEGEEAEEGVEAAAGEGAAGSEDDES